MIWEFLMAGRGRKFNFHGLYKSKAKAVKEERKVHGFIRRKSIKGKTRFLVLTPRN